jgi:aminoglycoside phosphotransferase (APT) family kinase protein
LEALVDLEERVWRYVCEVARDCALDAIISVVRFGGGDRHAVFKVTYAARPDGTDDLVVRVSALSDAAEREQVAREAAVLGALEGSAAPLLLDVCCDGRWFDAPVMCTEFIQGDHRELASATGSELEALGEVVGSVHARPVSDLAGYLGGPQTATGYLDQWGELISGYLPKLRQPLPQQVGSGLDRALSSVTRILGGPLREASPDAGEGLVLLHGDITPGNVLWADRPVLIDWEYARLGDPADDVAYIFGQHGLRAGQRHAFWSGYRRWVQQPALDRIAGRVRLWEPIILLGSALWWLERWSARVGADDAGGADPSVSKPQSYYLEQAAGRFARFETVAGQVPEEEGPA